MKRHPRFKISLTKTGYLFIGLSLGVGIAALNTGNNLLYLIFSLMMSFIILSGVLSNATLIDLQIQSSLPRRLFAHQEILIPIEVSNLKKRFTSFSLSIVPDGKDLASENAFYILKVGPKESHSGHVSVSFQTRGRVSQPGYRVETYFPFGLLKKSTLVHENAERTVFPEIRDLRLSDMALGQSQMGETLNHRKQNSGNPYGLRNYVQGDSYKRIHWKSSAKTQTLRMKEFEAEENQRIHLELILAPLKYASSDDTEYAISLAASLLVYIERQKIPSSLSINQTLQFPIGSSVDQILQALALCQAGPHKILKSRAPAYCKAILITNDSGLRNEGYVGVFDPNHSLRETA